MRAAKEIERDSLSSLRFATRLLVSCSFLPEERIVPTVKSCNVLIAKVSQLKKKKRANERNAAEGNGHLFGLTFSLSLTSSAVSHSVNEMLIACSFRCSCGRWSEEGTISTTKHKKKKKKRLILDQFKERKAKEHTQTHILEEGKKTKRRIYTARKGIYTLRDRF